MSRGAGRCSLGGTSEVLRGAILFLAATKQLSKWYFPSVRLWIYFTIWKKEKKNCHHYNTILSLYISYQDITRRAARKSNIPWIWRIIYGQKLPYMMKTRKKKQVCGAACFMAAEIKFSKDVRLSVTPFWLCSHHRIIMKFSGVITNDQRKVHAKGQGQRSRSQRSQPNLTVSGL